MTRAKLFSNPYLAAIFSAVLLRLSFPRFDLWYCAWFAFLPLFSTVARGHFLKTFLIGFIFGLLFYVATIFWLIHVTVAGMIVLSAYLGLYTALFLLGFRIAKERLNFWQRLFFVPSLWVLLEFSRSHLVTGFPWALLGYSQTAFLPMIQTADLFGAYGVSFIIVFANVVFFELILGRLDKKSRGLKEILIPVLILVVWFGYGVWRLQENPRKTCLLKVALVQGNISQDIKWIRSFQEKIFKKYELLTELAVLKADPDLIIWPETSFPDYIEFGSNDTSLKGFVRQTGIPTLIGSVRFKNLRYFNSALLYSSSGELTGIYDKIHLVPFGEYIPARKFLPFIETILPIEDFTPGVQATIFSVSGRVCPRIRFGVLICFEDIFSELASRSVRRGADFLVNMTNDAWFGDTSSPFEHMQASIFRAVENRVFVVRVANTGVSCILDDAGRVLAMVENAKGKKTFVTGYESGFVYKTGRTSLYTRIGDVFAFVCIAYAVLMLVLLRRRRS